MSFFLSCSSYKLKSLSDVDSDYEKTSNLFNNVLINTSHDPNTIIEKFNLQIDSTYLKEINANEIVTTKILINRLGEMKGSFFYTTINEKLNFQILQSLKTSKFKALNKNGKDVDYSIIVTFRFKSGKILCPLINRVPFSLGEKCNYEDPIEYYNADVKPEIIEKLVPIYPASERLKGIEGVSVTTVLINKNGQVEYAQIYKSLSNNLDQVSIDAAMKLKFKPGMKDDKVVNVKMNIPFMFSLKN